MFTQRNDKLHVMLTSIRQKLFVQQLLLTLVRFLIVGGTAASLLLLLALFLPVTRFRLEISFALIALSVAAGVAYAFMRRPALRQAAIFADRQGLEQRISTALDHLDNQSRIAQLQREDAIERLQRALPKLLEQIKLFQLPRNLAAGLLGSVMACIVLMLLPNAYDESLRLQALQEQEVAKLEEKVEKAQEDLQKDSLIEGEQRKQLEEIYQQLQKELKSLEDPQELAKAMEKTEMLLKHLQAKEQQALQALQSMQQMLANHEQTKGLAQALQQKEQAALQKALEEWQQKLEALPQKKQDEVAALLKKNAEELAKQAAAAENENIAELAANLQSAADALQNGQLPASMEQMTAAMQQAMQQAESNQAFANSLAQGLTNLEQSQMVMAAGSPAGTGASGSAQAGATPAGAVSAGTGGGGASTPANPNGTTPPSGTQAGSGTVAGQGQGAGAGSGNGNGNGNGNGSGNGSGNGTGRGGSGAGQGGGGAGLGAGSHELVAVPSERLDGKGGPSETVGGPLGEGASEMRESSQTQVTSGSVRPYAEVYQQYEQLSRQSLERSEIPEDYKEIVREYFQGIEP